MTKVFCDKCGRYITNNRKSIITYKNYLDHKEMEYCENCFYDILHFAGVHLETQEKDPRL